MKKNVMTATYLYLNFPVGNLCYIYMYSRPLLLPLHILACFLLSHWTLSCRHPSTPLSPSPSVT